MIKTIKKVESDYKYFNENCHFAKIIMLNTYFGAKSLSLTDLEFYPLIKSEIKKDSIKNFYRENIDEDWDMDINNFQERYKNLVELVLFGKQAIFLKFYKINYLKFFNIKDDDYDGILAENLFAPYLLKLYLKYTTNEDLSLDTSIEIIFKQSIENTLIVNEFISKDIVFDSNPIDFSDYILILAENEKKDGKTMLK